MAITYNINIKTGDTGEFILKSDLIVAHCSTAIQLAFFYKPVILVIPNELSENTSWFATIERFCKLLELKSYRSKEISNLKIFPKVNKEKYNQYIEKFIKINTSKNGFTWEIIFENLFL